MTFDEFKEYASKIKKIPLIGAKAHAEMSPNLLNRELNELEIKKRNPKNAAVMALFYPNQNKETHLVLILRNTYKGVHSAQIGFPGGREEVIDKDLAETALRETYEEVGVPPEEVEVLKKISSIYIPPSNFWVQPYIGICQITPTFVRQESEVKEILEIKLDDFLDDKNLVEKNISASYAQNVNVPAFLLNDQIVWGATAMMLSEVKGILKRTF